MTYPQPKTSQGFRERNLTREQFENTIGEGQRIVAREETAQQVWRWDHVEWEVVFEAGSLICSLGLCKYQEALPVTLDSQHSNIQPCLLMGWGFL